MALDNRPPEQLPDTSPTIVNPWNKASIARDVSSYRNNQALPAAASLVRSRPAATIHSTQDLRSLVQDLRSVSDDPFLQVKAIHDWIVLSLIYDAAGYFNNSIADQSWAAVLRQGKAVCQGYSNVLHEMLRLAGFQTVQVNGYARGVGHDNLVAANPRESNHAWNLVRIYDHWYAIDSTWDSGHLEGRTAKRVYSTDYFLIPPEWLIHSHYPAKPEWQLLDPPRSAEQFNRLPDLRGGFFSAVQDGHQELELRLSLAEPSVLELELHEGYQLSASLYDIQNGREVAAAFTQRSGSRASIFLAPPPGLYYLRFFAADTGSNRYGFIGELVIDSSNPHQISIPRVYADFQVHNTRILSPLMQAIRQNTETLFELNIEHVAAVFLVVNGREYAMEKAAEDLYRLRLVLPRTSKVDVIVQKSASSSRRSGLLSFPVLP